MKQAIWLIYWYLHYSNAFSPPWRYQPYCARHCTITQRPTVRGIYNQKPDQLPCCNIRSQIVNLQHWEVRSVFLRLLLCVRITHISGYSKLLLNFREEFFFLCIVDIHKSVGWATTTCCCPLSHLRAPQIQNKYEMKNVAYTHKIHLLCWECKIRFMYYWNIATDWT